MSLIWGLGSKLQQVKLRVCETKSRVAEFERVALMMHTFRSRVWPARAWEFVGFWGFKGLGVCGFRGFGFRVYSLG